MRKRRFTQSGKMKNVTHTLLLTKLPPPSIYPFCMSAFSHRQAGYPPAKVGETCRSEPRTQSTVVQCKCILLMRVSLHPYCCPHPCLSLPPSVLCFSRVPHDSIVLAHFSCLVNLITTVCLIHFSALFASISTTTMLTAEVIPTFNRSPAVKPLA